MAICSTRASGSGKAALKLPRLRSASIPRANRGCFSHGAYWTSLYRCNGKCTGRWYCHTHKRDPILRELISPVLGKPKKRRGLGEMSQASFALLIALALSLTVYFAVGAWQSSADDHSRQAGTILYERP
jgi:hypothetical protein